MMEEWLDHLRVDLKYSILAMEVIALLCFFFMMLTF
jgi:hypothetical protein